MAVRFTLETLAERWADVHPAFVCLQYASCVSMSCLRTIIDADHVNKWNNSTRQSLGKSLASAGLSNEM